VDTAATLQFTIDGIDGYDWGDRVGSARTDPSCWVVAYSDENFEDQRITIGPNSELRDLGNFEDDIDSIRILDNAP